MGLKKYPRYYSLDVLSHTHRLLSRLFLHSWLKFNFKLELVLHVRGKTNSRALNQGYVNSIQYIYIYTWKILKEYACISKSIEKKVETGFVGTAYTSNLDLPSISASEVRI